MVAKASSPIGANFTRRTTTAEFELNHKGCGTDGSEWIYVKANGSALAVYNMVGYTASGLANNLTKAIADAGERIAVVQTAFASNEFGWVCVCNGTEEVQVKVLASCAPFVRLYTTATAGSVDDTAASQTAVFGITVEETAGTSAGDGNGLTLRARVQYPHTEATA